MCYIDWNQKYIEFIEVGTDLEWEQFLDFCYENGVTEDYDDTDFEKYVLKHKNIKKKTLKNNFFNYLYM